jgi:membrane associated rhomboid family serine protease
MSALFRQLNPKARGLLVAGNLLLVLAILLLNFKKELSGGHAWFDGVCGFFFGLSLSLNLAAVVLAKRRRRNAC